ncbi:MAG: hypothetical protein KDC42_07035 [Ignavibacteriae bacterium]|nr:hypothetical protein [Ignavibacteriota bacterium]
MKKTLKILFLILIAILFNKPGWAQSYDAKLSLILYDSFPGYPNSTPYYDYYGGRYRVDVNGNNRTIRITHSIPSVLSDGAGHTIPFSIASNNAGYKVGGNLSPNGAIVFNPNLQLTVFLQATDKITVWLGGTVSPPTNAFPSNNYEGTITITTVVL